MHAFAGRASRSAPILIPPSPLVGEGRGRGSLPDTEKLPLASDVGAAAGAAEGERRRLAVILDHADADHGMDDARPGEHDGPVRKSAADAPQDEVAGSGRSTSMACSVTCAR